MRLGLMILLGCTYTSNALAGTAVSLRESYAGNLSFELTGGSLLDGNNCGDDISSRTSSETLNSLPFGAAVKSAWLYWAGSYNPNSNTGVNTVDSNITFTSPNGSRNVIASSMYTTSWGEDSSDTADPDEAYFNGKADVTNYVSSNGTYSVSNLSVHTADPQCGFGTIIAGWALVIIYEDDSEPFRVLNIFDGFTYYYGSQLALTPDNFTASSIPSGKHAHITWEGDQNNSGELRGFTESLKLNGIDLTDTNNPTDNQFNSYSNSIEDTTPGLDIDEYDIDSFHIPSGSTSATTTYSSGGDMVFLTAEIFSITNIPVADLSVTTSDPTGWQQGSTVTKKYTISNNGPNDVPTDSVRFTTTLPTGVSFTGTQGDSDWTCSPNPNTGQTISCIYNNKLRSGWSNYLDLSFIVDNGIAGSELTIDVTVDHDLAPYDIFDNQADNDNYEYTVPVLTTAITDLSASSKTYTNLSGDLLLAGDTLQYTITIDDASDLTASGITVTDDLPANISSYSVISSPVSEVFSTGGANNEGTLTFNNISLAAAATATIVIEVIIDSTAPEGASLQNTATINQGSDDWIVDTGDITIVEPDLSPSFIELSDKDGGLLLPGDTVTVKLTLDESYDFDVSDLQAIMAIPSQANDFTVISIPSGTDNSNSQIDIQNLTISSGETPTIEWEYVIDPSTSNGTVMTLNASLVMGSLNWTIAGPSIEVQTSTAASTGNKQLYVDTGLGLSRNIPTDGEIDITDEGSVTFTLTPTLASDLTFSLDDISIEFAFEGNRYRGNGDPRNTTPNLGFELRDNNGVLLASKTVTDFTLQPERIDHLSDTLDSAISDTTITLTAGQFLTLTVSSSDGNGTVQANRTTTLHIIDTIDSDLKGNGYSAVTLNASTVINVDNIQVFSVPYLDSNGDFVDDSGASQITSSQPDTTISVRAIISDPFGAFDVSGANISIQKSDGSSYDFGGDSSMTAIDDSSDDSTGYIDGSLAEHSKVFEKTFTLLEEDEIVGGWTISVTGLEGTEGDVEHTQIQGFTVSPFLPNIALSKSIKVISDPINLTVNPKAIPQAELAYTIKAVNTGRGKSDDASIIIEDEIPENSELYISDLSCNSLDPELTLINNNNGPVCFLTGITPNESGLSLDFASIKDINDKVWFAKADKDFSYEPDDTTEYDPAIRFIRVKLDGELNNQAKGSTDEPKFGLTYKVKLN